MMNRFINNFFGGILAGLAISFGSLAFAYASLYGSKVAGSILFGTGLLLVCFFKLKLYTGKIGKVFDNDKFFLLDLAYMLLGNLVGAFVTGYLVYFTLNEDILNVLTNIANAKTVDLTSFNSYLKVLIQSFFCGMLVYLAVEIYNKAESNVIKVVGLLFSVSIFVICSFSHCIANMFYLSAANFIFSSNFLSSFIGLLVSIIGNSIGAIALYFLFKVFNNSQGEKR